MVLLEHFNREKIVSFLSRGEKSTDFADAQFCLLQHLGIKNPAMPCFSPCPVAQEPLTSPIPGWFWAPGVEWRHERQLAWCSLCIAVPSFTWQIVSCFHFFFPPIHFHHFLKLQSFFFRQLSCAFVFCFIFHCLSLCSQRSDLETPASFKQAVSEEGGEKPWESAPPLPLPPPPSPLPLPGPLLRMCFRQHRSLDCGQASSATQLGSAKSWEWPHFVQ